MKMHKSTLAAVLTAALLAACAGTPNRESTGEVLDDSVITTKVKTALVSDKRVSGMDVSVETFKGRVLLSGYVRNPEERQTAERIARGVAGVKEVSNKIAVRGG
ncbi:MAG TPA: BON domain-containing protein [Burkholderiales bacterium]|jgi:osmotically-inducible protein OsmY|nr:BON domain-containing protein [Burkholderiales bacterium]